MNNFIIGFKKFITNKNVITIIGVLLILVILYWGYSSSIKKQTNPVNVPTAAKEIGPQKQITSSDVVYKQIANSMLSDNVIRGSSNIIGKYTNVNVIVPKGSVFYTEWVKEAEDIPGNWIEQLNYEEEELGYYMGVSIDSTLGNSIVPNSYIDIYMKAADENGTLMFGRLLENIKVLVVHDSVGNNVFSNSEGNSTPSKIGFGLNKELYILLKKAEYLNVELVIAPRGITIPSEDYVAVTSSTLKDYIEVKTIPVVEDIIVKEIEDENKTGDTQQTTIGENQQ